MPVHTPARRTRIARLGAAVLLTAALATTALGCSAEDQATLTSSTQGRAADHLTVSDVWIKAGSGMTGAFATLANDGDGTLRLESVTTDLAGKVELHETVGDGAGGMTMRPKAGGFTIEAGGKHVLAPGGDHIMLMGLTRAIAPGEEVRLVLRLSDGSTKTVTALVKDFTGAEEKYDGGSTSPSGSASPMDGMSGMGSGSDGS